MQVDFFTSNLGVKSAYYKKNLVIQQTINNAASRTCISYSIIVTMLVIVLLVYDDTNVLRLIHFQKSYQMTNCFFFLDGLLGQHFSHIVCGEIVSMYDCIYQLIPLVFKSKERKIT